MPNYNLSKFVSNEKYYDFKDVLILPTISSLNSRAEVDLTRKFFFNNGQKWKGIPIMAANMTTIGTLNVYKTLSKYKMLTALHKFHKLEDLIQFNKDNPEEPLDPEYFMISTGISDNHLKIFKTFKIILNVNGSLLILLMVILVILKHFV